MGCPRSARRWESTRSRCTGSTGAYCARVGSRRLARRARSRICGRRSARRRPRPSRAVLRRRDGRPRGRGMARSARRSNLLTYDPFNRVVRADADPILDVRGPVPRGSRRPMSGLFRRLSSRRSAGPEGNEPPEAAEPGATDAPAKTPAEPEGHRSLLTDPAAPTRVLRDGRRDAGDPRATPEATRCAGQRPDAPADADARPAAAPRRRRHAPARGPTPRERPAAAGRPAPAARPDAPTPSARRRFPAPPIRRRRTRTRRRAVRARSRVAYVAPPAEPVADLPAGLDPDELGRRARRPAPVAASCAAVSRSCAPPASCCCATSAASSTSCTARPTTSRPRPTAGCARPSSPG